MSDTQVRNLVWMFRRFSYYSENKSKTIFSEIIFRMFYECSQNEIKRFGPMFLIHKYSHNEPFLFGSHTTSLAKKELLNGRNLAYTPEAT